MKQSSLIFGLIKIPLDFLLGLAAFLTAYQLRSINDFIPGIRLPLNLEVFPNLNDYIKYSSIWMIVLIAIFALNKIYSLKNNHGLTKEIGKIWILTTYWFFLMITYYFLARTFPFSRLAFLFSFIFCLIYFSIGHIVLHYSKKIFLKKGYGKTRVLFIGGNEITEKIFKNLQKTEEFEFLGYIDESSPAETIANDLKFLGNISALSAIITKQHPEKIIQTKYHLNKLEAGDLRDLCRENHLEFSFVPDLLEVQQTNIEVETIAGIPVIQIKPTPLEGWGRIVKRIFDLIGAIVGLILLSPVLLICAILIKLDDTKGTIIYKYLDDGSRVKRVGAKGKLFNFYKFRTMIPNSHSMRYKELIKNNVRGENWDETSPLIKIKDDPRVTKVGRILRKTSLDELPQLFNVIKGEMSLVGPRPHLPEEVAKYQKHHKFVLTIKPGISGLAQISGRSDLNFEEEVRLDTYYIENWNIWLDLKIVIKTFLIIFKRYEE